MSYEKKSWSMLCSNEALLARAKLNNLIRDFFKKNNVIEVETPLLSSATVTDPFINSFEVYGPNSANGINTNKLYLQTSPEFAMKRMLCSGVGSIFQICKAFRFEEIGNNHNIEFSMLEWYRTGFNLDDLMAEMADLLSIIISSFNLENNKKKLEIKKYTYRELFLEYLNFDFNNVDINFLIGLIKSKFNHRYDHILDSKDFNKYYNKDDLLMILLSDYIEHEIDKDKLTFIYNYPSTQSALARLEQDQGYIVAKRFEVYYQGFELANGFHELADACEQQQRFLNDINKRTTQGLPTVTFDNQLISALEFGLPDCSGVALGLDRLLMALLGKKNIEDVISFR